MSQVCVWQVVFEFFFSLMCKKNGLMQFLWERSSGVKYVWQFIGYCIDQKISNFAENTDEKKQLNGWGNTMFQCSIPILSLDWITAILGRINKVLHCFFPSCCLRCCVTVWVMVVDWLHHRCWFLSVLIKHLLGVKATTVNSNSHK